VEIVTGMIAAIGTVTPISIIAAAGAVLTVLFLRMKRKGPFKYAGGGTRSIGEKDDKEGPSESWHDGGFVQTGPIGVCGCTAPEIRAEGERWLKEHKLRKEFENRPTEDELLIIRKYSTTVTRIIKFCYGHYLPNYNGLCLNQHGHNSTVEIECAGTMGSSPYPGMVIDFKDIKTAMRPIIEKLDHHNLNDVLPQEFLPPTAENISRYIFWKARNSGLYVIRVRVSETDNSFAETKYEYTPKRVFTGFGGRYA